MHAVESALPVFVPPEIHRLYLVKGSKPGGNLLVCDCKSITLSEKGARHSSRKGSHNV